MNWINEIWLQVSQYISVPYLLTFILLGYLVKRYFGKVLKEITGMMWRTVYTVLIIATVVAVPFILWTEIEWTQIVFSYALGTSLHELIFQWIEKLWKEE